MMADNELFKKLKDALESEYSEYSGEGPDEIEIDGTTKENVMKVMGIINTSFLIREGSSESFREETGESVTKFVEELRNIVVDGDYNIVEVTLAVFRLLIECHEVSHEENEAYRKPFDIIFELMQGGHTEGKRYKKKDYYDDPAIR